jgi:hypothetical protein
VCEWLAVSYIFHINIFSLFFLTLLAENDGISCNGDIKDTKKKSKRAKIGGRKNKLEKKIKENAFNEEKD